MPCFIAMMFLLLAFMVAPSLAAYRYELVMGIHRLKERVHEFNLSQHSEVIEACTLTSGSSSRPQPQKPKSKIRNFSSEVGPTIYIANRKSKLTKSRMVFGGHQA
jgi:hypothetical protein